MQINDGSEEVTLLQMFNRSFRKLAEKTAHIMGSPKVFVVSIFLIILWGISGIFLDFSDTWQLIINTGTTIATFLVVILIQNTQNRDAKSIHLKLDELVRGIRTTRNSLLEIEEQSDEEIENLKKEYKKLREVYIARVAKREQARNKTSAKSKKK